MVKRIICLLLIFVFMSIFVVDTMAIDEIAVKSGELEISTIRDYQKRYDSYEIGACSSNSTKTYMDYRAITARGSRQYQYIRQHMKVDESTGFLYDKDGFIGVALGSYYGVIGDRYYITLSNGNILPVVKIEEKADADTVNGCYHESDGSVIEFVIHRDYARNSFALSGNGLISSGNYNNNALFRGSIVKVEKVTNEINPNYVEYYDKEEIMPEEQDIFVRDIFQYASGY